MSNTRLSVNLNKIALLRNARGRDFPKVEDFAKMTLDNGAGGITLHPRPDQRHARYDDVYAMKKLLQDYPGAELNIEGKPNDKFMQVVLDVKPDQCTLVPDADDQVTSDHGWPMQPFDEKLFNHIKKLKSNEIRVSLFMDPDLEDMTLVKQYEADSVELYTEDFARCFERQQPGDVSAQLLSCLKIYDSCALCAREDGMLVNAGHDLNLDNLPLFLTHVNGIDEVSIGHALTVEALHYGFEATIKKYISAIQNV